MAARTDVGRLILSCPDRHGIIAALATALAQAGANIVTSDQHSTDPEGGDFFLRTEFHLPHFEVGRPDLERDIGAIAERFAMHWQLTSADVGKRVLLLASQQGHCLLDLLWRWRTSELEMDVVGVVSNHPDHKEDVERFGVPYFHIPVSPDTKVAAEGRLLDRYAGRVDLIVLARYMQILSPEFLERIGTPVINIHHSFLPAFPGRDPHLRAHKRGVKLIGATAHYATKDLDQGPIIEQDVARIDHRAGPEDLARLGRDLERMVLARAVSWHLEDRVIVHGNRTIVF